MICPSCGGDMELGLKTCPYCGKRLEGAPVAQAALPPKPGSGEQAILCPHCVVWMEKVNCGDFVIDECPKCRGRWYDAGELDQALKSFARVFTETDIAAIRRAVGKPSRVTGEVKYIRCPKCAELMVRKNFGGASGIIVDKCKEHGTWLDGGEFDKIAVFVEKGGLLIEQQTKMNEHARRAEARAFASPEPPPIVLRPRGLSWIPWLLS
jgi:Zn-finger nucleic acid-binding protein